MNIAEGAAPVLRPYQLAALGGLDALRLRGVRAVLLVAPTGSGKTVIAAEIVRRAKDKRVLFLAPRRELIHQTTRKLNDAGVKYGVLMAGDKRTDIYAQVQVASVDTLVSRVIRSRKLDLAPFDIVIVDEAHVGLTDRRQALLACWPDAEIIGLTATPCRSDGKAMGAVYDEMLEVSTTRELTDTGYLCPARYFSVSEPDLRKVRTTAGDYNRGDLDGVMNQPKLTGDIVEHFLTHAPTRRTVVFATTISHSVALAQNFLQHGVAAEHVDANTPQLEREAIFERFSSGRTQVLTNCTLASLGFDLPELDCVVLARPTKSVGLYLQMLGRGLRIASGKQNLLVLDHSGVVHAHGFATDQRHWTLHGKYASDVAKTERSAQVKLELGLVKLTCPECRTVWEGGRQCPSCGYYFAPKAKKVRVQDGQLIEVKGKARAPMTEEQQRLFYLQLYGHGEKRGYKPGWAANKFKTRMGEWPKRVWEAHCREHGGIDPTLTTARWITSQNIQYARSQEKKRAQEALISAPDLNPHLNEYMAAS